MKALIIAAVFLWPWQYHARHHAHHPRQPALLQALPPDCAQINAVVKGLTPERYERALRQVTKEQQQIIADCMVQP